MKEIFEQINHATLSQRQLAEGSENPTTECKELAIEVAHIVYSKYSLIPLYASATVEDGVFIAYKNKNIKLHIEVYNDLDVATVVSNDVDIMGSFNIEELDFDKTVKTFYGGI